MYWSYDPTADAFAIELRPDKEVATSRELYRGVIADYDAHERLISIEILDASFHLPRSTLKHLPLPDMHIPLSLAAKRVGLDPATLRQQIRNKRLSAIKRNREWWVDMDAVDEYLRNRAPQGRRSNRNGRARRSRERSG